MKMNATKRALALLLTLAMLLPNLTGALPVIRAEAAEGYTTGTATVYDLYDLTGETAKTIYGRVQTDTWDQSIGTVAEAHKGNVAFTAKVTVGSEYEHIFIGLGMTGANASSTTDGYIFEIQAKVGEPDAVVYHKKGASWQASSQGLEFDFNGTYVLEAGVVDLYENGALVGKRAYLKADGQEVCHWDDTGSPVTTENLSTTVGIYNEQNNITLESTYSSGYGTANVYDIYDLTGSAENTYKGGYGGNWSNNVIGNINEADRGNAALKTKVTISDLTINDNTSDLLRLSLGETSSDNVNVNGCYALRIYTDSSKWYYGILKNDNGTTVKSVEVAESDLKGTYELEFGYRDITFAGDIIGKQIYLKKNGEEILSYEDTSGYLTSDAMTTTVSVWGYCSSVQMDTTYESSYGTVNVYDIADLTGSENNSFNGALNSFDVSTLAVPEESKENVALKAMLSFNDLSLSTNMTELLRLSLSATQTNGAYHDCSGYALQIYTDGTNWYYVLKKNNGAVKQSVAITGDDIKGPYEMEFGYRDIKLGDNVVGKQVYLKKNGETILTYDDTSNWLTGDTLTNVVTVWGYCATIQMDTTNVTTYGEVNTYDIADLTGSSENYYYGSGNSDDSKKEWNGAVIGNVSGDKENVGFKATVTVAESQNVQLSLGALEANRAVNFAGYSVYFADNWASIYRNATNNYDDKVKLCDISATMTGTYVLEFSIQSILLNGEVTGKRLTVKKDGAVIGTYDDLSGFLTGDTLGTKIEVYNNGTGIQMDTTYTSGYGEVKVYDIYDLTGNKTNTYTGVASGNWSVTQLNVSAADKENIAFKAELMVDDLTLQSGCWDLLRLSLSATNENNESYWNNSGYGLRIYNSGDNWFCELNKNKTGLVTGAAMTGDEVLGEHEIELGYQDIIELGIKTGKRVFLKWDGVEVLSHEDKTNWLTGDSLTNVITVWGYGTSLQLNTTYETSYGEVTVYDISDLTGSRTNAVNGAAGSSWFGTVLGNVDSAKKENIALKANVTMDTSTIYSGQKILFNLSLSASATTSSDGTLSYFDCSGYAMQVYSDGSGNWYYALKKNNGTVATSSAVTADVINTLQELELGYRDIIFNGNVIGKQVYLKKDGADLLTYSDTAGYLTGDTLTTEVAAGGYCSTVQMDTTLPVSFVHGYNLTLGGRTVINLYLDPEIIGDPAATVTVKVEGEKVTQTYNLQDLPTNADGYRIVNVKLASGQMNDAVTVTAIPGSGEPMSKVYSVAGYVKYILGENYPEDLKQLARDLLHYGAAAQVYFDYNADSKENLANYDVDDTKNNDLSRVAPEKTVEGSVDGISVYGASLIMRDDTTLRYYLNITGDVKDYTFTINGAEVAPRKVNSTVTNYCVQYDGILPNRLGDVYTLIVSKGSSTMAVSYSPTVYMKNIYSKDGSAQALAQQLYDYYMSAKAYAGSQQIDTPIVLDLYQVYGAESATVPANGPFHLGMLMTAEDGLVKTELTSNMAIRFKYTGNDGMRIQIGATTPDLSVVSGGALFMSVPPLSAEYSVGSFGIANPADNGNWIANNSYVQDTYLYKGQDSYIELGCVKVYTDGAYTHDRYYVRAAASLEELDTMAQNGTFSVYYDTAMKSNNGNRVIIRTRTDGVGGDVLATTWTDDQIQAYDASLRSAAQNATSGDYDKLAEEYPDTVDTSNTASSLAAAKNPTGSTTATGGDELILWAESGASKIVQDDDGRAATQAAQKNTLSIQMAKNEDEGAQLMLFGKRNVEDYEIFVTDLTSGTHVISADNIRLYQLKYLTVDDKYDDTYSGYGKVDTYDTPSLYKGEKLPDAMLPFAKAVEYGENVILAGNNQAIYVDVSTDSTDAAGTYTGTIVVKTNTDQVYTLPISVVVQDVVMPEISKLGTYAPYLDRKGFSSGELDGSDEMAALYVQTLESFNMSSIAPTSDGVMNLEKFLVNVRRSYDSATNYMLPVDNNDSYYTVDGTSTLVYCNYALLKEYVVALADMSIADGKNYLDKAFFYPSDHVDESKTEEEFNLAKATYQAFCQMLDDADAELTDKYSGTSKYTSAIAESVKTLRFLLTVPGDDDNGKSLDIGDLYTDFLTVANRKNVIICTTNEVLVREGYGDDVADAMNGTYADELWTYLCLKPWIPYSNYAFDTPVVGLRTLGWTCYQENIDTLMTWKSVDYLYEADGLSLDRWTTSSAGKDTITPGDGNMFYPGAKYGIDGACPSLRAMAWRDGVDDYNLMSAVVENGGSADSLNSLYSLITESYTDTIKASAETGSWWEQWIDKKVDAIVPIDDDAKFIIVRNALLQMAASNASQHAAILSNAQTAVNGVTAASGTTAALENPNAESSATITGNIYTGGYYQLADFETYEETIQNKFMGNAQLALSDLTQDGGYSLQVAVQPGQDGETVWIPTTSQYFSATTNFTGATQVTFKVYNAQTAGSTVRFYLNTYNRASDDKGVYNAGTYNKADADIWHDDHSDNTSIRKTLKHGWNEITINLDDLGVSRSYVGAFIIAFDSGVCCDAQQVFYLDDVRVYMSQVG